ncbi:hypothetical protein Peur_044356 [Populus x canadensis]
MGLARPMAPQSAIAPTSDGEYHEQKIPKISLSCASSSADLPECIELATKSPITAAANRCCSALSAITVINELTDVCWPRLFPSKPATGKFLRGICSLGGISPAPAPAPKSR